MTVPRVSCRAALRALFPPRIPTPLETCTLSVTACGDHTRELVEYAVAAGERVRAFLLLPSGGERGDGPAPGVIASHQHADEYWLGKSQPAGLTSRKDAMYHYGVDLCRQGFVVLCPDHLGFEERCVCQGQGSLCALRSVGLLASGLCAAVRV